MRTHREVNPFVKKPIRGLIEEPTGDRIREATDDRTNHLRRANARMIPTASPEDVRPVRKVNLGNTRMTPKANLAIINLGNAHMTPKENPTNVRTILKINRGNAHMIPTASHANVRTIPTVNRGNDCPAVISRATLKRMIPAKEEMLLPREKNGYPVFHEENPKNNPFRRENNCLIF
jgi:hypothetical protein